MRRISTSLCGTGGRVRSAPVSTPRLASVSASLVPEDSPWLRHAAEDATPPTSGSGARAGAGGGRRARARERERGPGQIGAGAPIDDAGHPIGGGGVIDDQDR